VRLPIRRGNFLSFKTSTKQLLNRGGGGIGNLPGVKGPVRKTDHTSQFNAELKN
jgi:hypothetical protein